MTCFGRFINCHEYAHDFYAVFYGAQTFCALQRKIAEVFIALKLEREYEKQEVLEFYVNRIYYGSGYYSIYDASKGYFGKEPKDMTDYECTLLVGIPNAPSVYSLDVRPDVAEERQKKVIDCMVEVGYITENESIRIFEKE